MPTPTKANVLKGSGYLYTAPVGTSKPADTVAFGTTWTAPWTYVGATSEGFTVNLAKELGETEIDESSIAIGRFVESAEFSIASVLREDTFETLKLAAGGGTLTTQAAASGVIGKQTIVLTDTVDEIAVGYEVLNPQGFWTRVIVPTAVPEADLELQYSRTGDREYGISLQATCLLSAIDASKKTANALP